MGRKAKYALILLVLSGYLVSLHQCSPRAGQHLLTLFFDGVPVTDSIASGASPDSAALAGEAGETVASVAEQVPSLVVHYPYAERECELCHDPGSLGRMLEPQPDLCYMCHEDLGALYPLLHGPVGGGYCTACHDPHTSDKSSLLRLDGRALCLYCHLEEDVLRNEIHEGMEEMECTDCHNPHGGEDSSFLY